MRATWATALGAGLAVGGLTASHGSVLVGVLTGFILAIGAGRPLGLVRELALVVLAVLATGASAISTVRGLAASDPAVQLAHFATGAALLIAYSIALLVSAAARGRLHLRCALAVFSTLNAATVVSVFDLLIMLASPLGVPLSTTGITGVGFGIALAVAFGSCTSIRPNLTLAITGSLAAAAGLAGPLIFGNAARSHGSSRSQAACAVATVVSYLVIAAMSRRVLPSDTGSK